MVPQGHDYRKTVFLDWWLKEGQFAYRAPSPELVEAMNEMFQGVFLPSVDAASGLNTDYTKRTRVSGEDIKGETKDNVTF